MSQEKKKTVNKFHKQWNRPKYYVDLKNIILNIIYDDDGKVWFSVL